jgi:hypothetical protein
LLFQSFYVTLCAFSDCALRLAVVGALLCELIWGEICDTS